MSKRLLTRRIGALGMIITALAAMIFGLSGSAMAADGGPNLVLEPYAACAWNSPFALDAKELGWKIFQGGPQGTPGQNDWKCDYKVSITVPTGLSKGEHGNVEPDDMNLAVPGLYDVEIPIDWQQMCRDQYGDSADIKWVGGTSGSIGSPWACFGTPGQSYNTYDINTAPPRLQGTVNAVLAGS